MPLLTARPTLHTTRRPGLIFSLAFLAAMLLALLTSHATRGAGLLIAEGGLGGTLEIVSHEVEVTINNGIAVTEVQQVFRNTENRIVEALYTFPVPKEASVANFSMWIEGREMIGEVLEKERAREIYDTYRRQARPKDPGLLEQVDHKTFEMRIFPIAAGAEQRVRITYYQHLEVDHDRGTYVYPLATTTRPGLDARVHGRFALRLRVLSEIPIRAMGSPSHPQAMVFAAHDRHHQEASLELAGGDLTRDLVIAYDLARPATGIDLITSRPEGEDGYFMLTLTAGEELAGLKQPMDYLFVLDISGSMAHGGKLLVSKDAIAAFLEALAPEDRFELIAFNIRPETAFSELRAADAAGQKAAAAFLDSQQARGGTVLTPALQLAYRYGEPDRPLNVVILSDGMTEQRERAELLKLIRQAPAHARVFCIGVGNEVNRPLLGQLAEEAGGLAAFLSQGDDLQHQARSFRRKLTRPIATNLKITFEGADVYDVEPTILPNLFHGAPVTMFGRYRGGGNVQIHLSGDVMGRALKQKVRHELPTGDGGNPPIERMWALKRVQQLLREADRQDDRSAVIPQIIALGERYAIVTEYTSFIVLENDAEYQRWQIERRNLSRFGRDDTRHQALREQLDRMRDRAMSNLGPAPQQASSDGKNRDQGADPTIITPQAQPPRDRGVDLNFGPPSGGGGGAGAIDPVTGLVVLTLGGALLLRRPRTEKRDTANDPAA